jgi:hypothetical protein
MSSVRQDHGRCDFKLQLHELSSQQQVEERTVGVSPHKNCTFVSLFVKQCKGILVCEIPCITDVLQLRADTGLSLLFFPCTCTCGVEEAFLSRQKVNECK